MSESEIRGRLIYLNTSNEEQLEQYLASAAPICPRSPRIRFENVLTIADLPGPLPNIASNRSTISVAHNQQTNCRKVYQKITDHQIDKLIQLFNSHKNDTTWKVDSYSRETSIERRYCQNLLSKLKKGQSIQKKHKLAGRRKILVPEAQEILFDELKKNSRSTLSILRLISGKKQLESQNIDYSSMSDSEIMSYSVHESNIWRLLHKGLSEKGVPPFTYKMSSSRMVNSNDDESKINRCNLVTKLLNYDAQGYITVYIDESHWKAEAVKHHAWSAVGTKAHDYFKRGGVSLTAIASISLEYGAGYTELHDKSVDMDIFNTFMKNLISYYNRQNTAIGCNRRFLFVMDNCRVHKSRDLKRIVEESGYKMKFNIAYSPELNPIEKFFGVWKLRAEESIKIFTSKEKFLNDLALNFKTIESEEICRIIKGTHIGVWNKVRNMEDL